MSVNTTLFGAAVSMLMASSAFAQVLPAPEINGEVIGTPELVEAACREGNVTYYTGQDGNDERQIIQDFEAAFPCVTVSVVSVGTSQLYERILSETQAGQVLGDVVMLSDIALAGNLIDAGLLRQWAAPSADMYPATGQFDGWWYAASSTAVYPIYNIDLVTGDDIPTTWEDLLDSHWANSFALGPVNVGGPQWVQYAFMLDVLGEDYIRGLLAQNPQINTTFNAIVLGVGRGELRGGIVAHVNDYPARVLQGAPTMAVLPEAGVPISYYPMMLMKGSAHPAAAELFANYYLSKTGQSNLVRIRGAYSGRTDVAPAEGNPPINELNLWNPGYEAIRARHSEVIARVSALFEGK